MGARDDQSTFEIIMDMADAGFGRIDDQTMLTMITDCAERVRGRIPTNVFAILCGLAAELARRFRDNMPPPAYFDEDGQPMYTSEQLAAHLGCGVQEVRAAAEELAKREKKGRFVRIVEPSAGGPVQ